MVAAQDDETGADDAQHARRDPVRRRGPSMFAMMRAQRLRRWCRRVRASMSYSLLRESDIGEGDATKTDLSGGVENIV